jgi:hypothetical protein
MIEVLEGKYDALDREIVNIVTNDSSLKFLWKEEDSSYCNGEEYFLEGTTLCGLRPSTEEELKELCRDREPTEFLGIGNNQWSIIEPYFDWDKWQSDQEDDWYDTHDTKAERQDADGDTLYLGWGSSGSLDYHLRDIEDYEALCDKYAMVGITEKQFNLLKKYIDDSRYWDDILNEDWDSIYDRKTRDLKEKFTGVE